MWSTVTKVGVLALMLIDCPKGLIKKKNSPEFESSSNGRPNIRLDGIEHHMIRYGTGYLTQSYRTGTGTVIDPTSQPRRYSTGYCITVGVGSPP